MKRSFRDHPANRAEIKGGTRAILSAKEGADEGQQPQAPVVDDLRCYVCGLMADRADSAEFYRYCEVNHLCGRCGERVSLLIEGMSRRGTPAEILAYERF